jgi:hypothetical protein
MKAKVKAILDDLVARISAETMTKFVRERLFIDDVYIPCRQWSALNQFFVSLAGTVDARGIRQWNSVGRRIVKGAHALYILIPIIVPRASLKEGEDADSKKSQDDGLSVLVGFKAMPVFRVEDTEGDVLPYEIKIKAFDISSLPLIEVARELGVNVRAGLTEDYSGVYNRKTKEIILGTDNPQTFLHELSHAVDAALPGRSDDYSYGEVVAELSSCFLGSLYGVSVDVEATKSYIEDYTGKGHVAMRIMEALGRVESIYRYIEKVAVRQPMRSKVADHNDQHLKIPDFTGNQGSLVF